MRKLLFMLLSAALMLAGLALTPAAQAADTGKTAPQSGKIVSEEPGVNAPNILQADGEEATVYSIAQVGNTIVVGGQFSQVQNFNTSTSIPRKNVFAFDATTGKVLPTFAPNPTQIAADPATPDNSIVYKVEPAADGTSVYVAGRFNSAAGQAMTSRLFKADVATGTVDTTFAPPKIDGDIRDLEVTGNRLWVAGKFVYIGAVVQRALGTLDATTGARDPYFTAAFAGTHRDKTVYTSDKTNVLQISTNPANDRLVAVGNFTSVNGAKRSQIAQFNIGGASYTMTPWYTTLYESNCRYNFETTMTDVEYSPDGSYFVVSTTGAWGGTTSATGSSGCDVVARFESSSRSGTSKPSWTNYTGGDTTWTVEVTDNVVYAGGHQMWQNNPSGHQVAGPGAVAREGIAALNPVNGLPYSWNPTRARGVGVQDLLATSAGLYVGSDTTLIGKTPGNRYHARIAFLPLADGKRFPAVSPYTLPGDLYFVKSAGSQLVRKTHSGSALISSANAPNGPGWGTSVGAFMVNGVLYKANKDGSLSKQTFDGTTYGPASPVNTSDLLAEQKDWHTDIKTITSLFYADGYIYYTKSGVNALYRRGFETESDVVSQHRLSSTTTGINFANSRGAFVANGKLYFGNTAGRLYTATWNPAAHAPTAGTTKQIGSSGWMTRTLFPYQGDPGPPNDAPSAAITGASCTELSCSFNGSTSSDPDGDTLTYSWDFGDASSPVTTENASHTYADAGARTVTLTVDDGKGHTDTDTVTVNPTAPEPTTASNIALVGATSANGNKTTHSAAIPSGVSVGDTLIAFFTANTTARTFTPPSGWTQLDVKDGNGIYARAWTKTATSADVAPGAKVNVIVSDTGAKADITVAAYRGTDLGSPIQASASRVDNVAGADHTSPSVTAEGGSSWLVTYFAEKSSETTGWTSPSGQSERAASFGGGTSHISALLTDSNGPVSPGARGELTATANSLSSRGASFSILLKSS